MSYRPIEVLIYGDTGGEQLPMARFDEAVAATRALQSAVRRVTGAFEIEIYEPGFTLEPVDSDSIDINTVHLPETRRADIIFGITPKPLRESEDVDEVIAATNIRRESMGIGSFATGSALVSPIDPDSGEQLPGDVFSRYGLHEICHVIGCEHCTVASNCALVDTERVSGVTIVSEQAFEGIQPKPQKRYKVKPDRGLCGHTRRELRGLIDVFLEVSDARRADAQEDLPI